ncbi:hypothetical protein LSCM1_06576 [Leishmania martiniquensis]|uniref:Uncharacterized protein n=1 Tax=Leishmania martiniquensis TaxID=1580590 RepID=A0A836HIH1_9TRYP|nr:hypothetical protein LSCM1_06576 [Leishmania martiniquensis]
MGDQWITESQVRSSVIDGSVGLPPSPTARQESQRKTGIHIARIFRALQQLQPRASAPPASSLRLPRVLTLEDGAAAWMCCQLDLLWEAMATPAATTPEAQVNAAAMPTHPRTEIVLQLFALDALRRERRRGAFSTSSPSHSSLSTAASLQGAPGRAASSASASTACCSLRLVPSGDEDIRFEMGGLHAVQRWLWQRAAALPSEPAVAMSPYGDLSALMTEWATLTLPAWLESPEETRWRRERDGARRLMHELAAGAAARSPVGPTEEAKEVKEAPVTAASVARQSATGAADTAAANGANSLNSNEVASMPQAKDTKDEAVTAPTVHGPLLVPTADDASPSPPRRVLKLGVAAAVKRTTARLANPSAATDADAVACLPSRGQSKESAEQRTIASGTVMSLAMPSPPQYRAADTPTLSSASAIDTHCRDVISERRLTMPLLHSLGTLVPLETAPAAATISAEPSRRTAASELGAKVMTRTPMLLSDEDATDEDTEARGSIVEARTTAQDAVASVSPTSETRESARARTRSRLCRWRRLAPAVLDAPPGSEAAENVCTLLEELGFAIDGEDGLADKSLRELTLPCCSAASSGELLKPWKTPVSPRANESGAPAPKPRCPLGRLPPLLAAHAWLANMSLRSSWLTHILAMPDSESSLTCGDGGEPRLEEEEATLLSSVPQATPLTVPTPPASPVAFCSPGSPPRPPLPAALPALPCIALADHRVFEMLDELLWCAYPSTTAFLISLEKKLHEYLCYPLAGVRGAATVDRAPREAPPKLEEEVVLTGRATPAPRPLPMSLWKAYLELRYGAVHPRRSQGSYPLRSKMGTATKAAALISGAGQHTELHVAADAARATAGDHRCVGKWEARVRMPDDEAAQQPAAAALAASAATGERAPLAPFAAAAVAASSSPTASTFTYAAVMDVAAMVFLAELRRLGALAMTEKAMRAAHAVGELHARCGAGLLQTAAQQRAGASGESAASGAHLRSTDDAENVRRWASAAADAANTSSLGDANGMCGDSVSSLQALLEGTVESDTALHRYACRRLTPLSVLQLAATTRKGTEVSQKGGGEREKCTSVAAGRVWLALMTVLSLGESAVAQYVRGVLMPPPSVPVMPSCYSPVSVACTGAAAEAIGASSQTSRTSLAPLTMPTLFRSTLEDLYQEESAAIAAAAAEAGSEHRPPPQPFSPPLCAAVSLEPEEDSASGAPAKGRFSPAHMTEATLATQDTLVLSAAVALRHPRSILRQLRFLWQLSCDGNHGASVTRAGVTSPRSGRLTLPTPAPPHTSGTVTHSPKAVEAVDSRAAAGNAGGGLAPSCKEAFASRIASLVECVQLASLAGLPPPLAASLTPARPSSSAALAEDAGRALRRDTAGTATPGCSAAIRTSSDGVAPLQQRGDTVAFPSLVPPSGADLANTVTTPATAIRLRLQLSSKPSPSDSDRATVCASRAQSTGGVKRSRELHETSEADVVATSRALPSSAGDAATRSSRPEKSHRADGAAMRSLQLKPDSWTRAPPPPPPSLESLAEVHVRWAGEAQGGSVSTRLSLTPSTPTPPLRSASGDEAATSRPTLLLSVVACTLWDVLQDIHTQMPGAALSSARVACGDGSGPASDPSAAIFAASAILARDGEAAPGEAPVRRTLLRLCAGPAYRALQRLWQALRSSPVSERGVRGSSDAEAPPCTDGAAGGHPRLDVLLPATASGGPTPVADLRVYHTLTASLRGVVGVVLGYAVYAGLRAICCGWCARCDAHTGAAMAAGCTTASSDAPPPPPRTRFSPSYESYAWLAGQLRALHDNVLQPLNRILTVPVPGMDGDAPARGLGAPTVMGGGSHRPAVPISSLARPPNVTHSESLETAAWLSYNPLGLVLLPALIRQLEASISHSPPDNSAVTSGGRHGLDAHGAWAEVKAALGRAGVHV